MIIRLTYLTSALSLAAASKSAKTPGTPSPTDASKAGKATGSKSSKGKTSDEYFIAPFSCPQLCISAQGYELSSHLLDDAVSECDASDNYQKWKVHQGGAFLKFESAAQHDEGMCLAVVHPDPDHPSKFLQIKHPDSSSVNGITTSAKSAKSFSQFKTLGGIDLDGSSLTGFLPSPIDNIWTLGFVDAAGNLIEGDPPVDMLYSGEEVNDMCSGQLGLAKCDHPGSYWYNTGGSLLSTLCWNQGVSATMSVDGACTDLSVTSNSTIHTTSETFMLFKSPDESYTPVPTPTVPTLAPTTTSGPAQTDNAINF